MAAIVAPGIARFTVNGVFNGRPVANILDMQVDTTGSILSRAESCFTIAGDIINNWADHVLPIVSSQYQFTSVSWVDLDSLTASTGERSSTSDTDLPAQGSASGGTAQGNVAFRVNKAGVASRGQRAGRMYLVGVSEDANENSNGNQVNTAWQGYVNQAMQDFLDGITDQLDDPQRQLVVVHVVDGLYQGYSEVTNLSCDPRFGSQRRRLRG